MTIFWVIEFDYASRLHHGAIIRYVNYARELTALGHRVYFGAQFEARHRSHSDSCEWFRDLQETGILSGWIELCYAPPFARARAAALALSPVLSNPILKAAQSEVVRTVLAFVERAKVDVVIVSSRRLLFLVDRLSCHLKVVADFGDSMALYYLRSAKAALAQRSYKTALSLMKPLVQYALQERHYARKAIRSLLVSPVDKRALDRLSGRADRSAILLNGVRIPPAPGTPGKVPFQLIFTGNMSFPPNYEAALWFLDFVFPLIQQQIPQVTLVLAGADPPPQLLKRAGHHVSVTGFVEDLNAEIARSSLFVAPLISGGGFKNKVVEALANRTYVVACPLAVEFLEPLVRRLITVEADPARMASAIVRYLRDPCVFADRLQQLHAYVRDRMSWGGRASELLQLLESA